MGKAQYKKKMQGKRHNPMRVPDAHLGPGKGAGANDVKEREMLPILNKLKSPQYADRTWACAAICNLIQNDPATRRLFQGKNVVGALIERLSDDVDEVLVEASGALRNLAIDGGHELCSEMFNKGIMPHLSVLITKISGTIDSILLSTPGDSQSQDQSTEHLQARKHLLALSENVISLVWSLTEANHKTLAAVNAINVEGLLLRILEGRSAFGLGVAVSAAQAIYALSQDNPPFKRAVVRNEVALQTLVGVARADHIAAKGKGKAKKQTNGDANEDDGRGLLMRILVCGVLRNLVDADSRADSTVGISALTNSTILPLINGLLDLNLNNVVAQVTELSAQTAQQSTNGTNGNSFKSDHRSPAEQALERIERTLMTVTVALEVLTGICAGVEDAEEVDDEEQLVADEDDGMEEDESIPDETLVDMARDSSTIIDTDAEPLRLIKSAATLPHLLTTLHLPTRLLALSQLTPFSFPPSNNQPAVHPPTTSALSVLHLRALEALNNLLITTAAVLPSSPQAAQPVHGNAGEMVPLQSLWDGMFSMVEVIASEPEALQVKGQEMRLEVMEMALGAIWGVLKIATAAAPPYLVVQEDKVRLLVNLMPVLRSSDARTRLIDTLALVAARPDVSVAENRELGTWLVQLLSSPSSSPVPLDTELTVAIVNAIIDVYADETRAYDQPVFVASGFLQVLTGLLGSFRTEVKRIDKRKFRELHARADEAYENLAAFIKYRRGLRR